MTHLSWLSLYGMAVDGDVSGLGGLTQLSYLNLYGTAVDGDVSGLGGLTQLTALFLSGTAVDGDVSGLGGLTHLSALFLRGTGCYGDSSVLPSSLPFLLAGCARGVAPMSSLGKRTTHSRSPRPMASRDRCLAQRHRANAAERV